ncbi:MAG: hypothetical protein IPL35_13475 [Sphingobacteriales bacterium]|nr:hypothetical protein [Sphingobacteriales bacterium]
MTEQKAKGSNEFKEGYYREIHRRYTENNSNIMLTYDRRVTPDFNLTLNIGGNMMRQKLSRIVGEVTSWNYPVFITYQM